MDTVIISHRRDRQQTRRILAHIRTQCRDLAGRASGDVDLDLVGDRHRQWNVRMGNGGRH